VPFKFAEHEDGMVRLQWPSALKGPDLVDLLFTDIKLPGAMNGFRLAERAQHLRMGLPVLYATGFTDENPAGIESSRFFLKPYSIAAVIQKTWSLLATP
jgi:DNA-binding LytR/AlgR family response regulator